MRTNIILDDNLIEEAFKYSNVKTKKALISLALQDYINNNKRKNLLDLVGKIDLDDKYNYKETR